MGKDSIDKQSMELSPEEIASHKLDEISAEDFSQFGIRFMNMEEYRHIIEEKKYSQKKSIGPVKNGLFQNHS